MILLLPIADCCAMRFTTVRTLLNYHTGPEKLSEAMRRSLSTDDLAPVLLDTHLDALDRRIKIVLQTLSDCLEKKPVEQVIIDDGF